MSGMLYSIPVILTGYRIVQIEDEATPLAQAVKSGYYGDTVASMPRFVSSFTTSYPN
jgi:hypothetical protein